MSEDNFERSLKFVLKIEGGFTHDAADSGGATNLGITQSEYDRDRKRRALMQQSVFYISADEAHAIYLKDYWIKGKCDLMPWPVCLAHFDACVNTGILQAGKFLQRACGATVDGVVGPMTLQKLEEDIEVSGEHLVASRVAGSRAAFYRALVDKKPSQGVFLRGWLNRLGDLTEEMKNV